MKTLIKYMLILFESIIIGAMYLILTLGTINLLVYGSHNDHKNGECHCLDGPTNDDLLVAALTVLFMIFFPTVYKYIKTKVKHHINNS